MHNYDIQMIASLIPSNMVDFMRVLARVVLGITVRLILQNFHCSTPICYFFAGMHYSEQLSDLVLQIVHIDEKEEHHTSSTVKGIGIRL